MRITNGQLVLSATDVAERLGRNHLTELHDAFDRHPERFPAGTPRFVNLRTLVYINPPAPRDGDTWENAHQIREVAGLSLLTGSISAGGRGSRRPAN